MIGDGLESFDHFLGPYLLVFFCNSLYLLAKNGFCLSSPLIIRVHLGVEDKELLIG